jgi:hypothetical protein
MFCVPGLIFGRTGGIGSRLHVLCASKSFSAVLRTLDPIFMCCALGLIFGVTEGVGTRFNVLRSRTRVRWYRGRGVPFSCFALLDSFLEVPRASGLVFMLCAPDLIFGGTEGVRSCFHVLHARTHFRRYRGRRVPFKCFALPDSFSCFAPPDSFSEVPRASGPFLTFYAPGLILSGTDGVGSLFHVLRSRTHFRWYGGHQVPFSCFALPDSFSAIPRASGPFFMFCAPRLVFGDTRGVGSCLYVLRSRTHFQRYPGRPIPFSCFPLPYMFFGVLRASGPFLTFCKP